MLILIDEQGREVPDEVRQTMFGRMAEFAMGLAQDGKLTGGAPLKPPEEAARIRAEGHKVVVTDGPFAETKEIIAGYFVLEVGSRDEAVEIAKRCPQAEVGVVEVREIIP